MPNVIYFRHKNGHEYIGESQSPLSVNLHAHPPSHVQRLTKARIVEGVNIPTAGPNGELQIVTRFVLRPIVLSNPNIEEMLFTSDDICYGQSGQPSPTVLDIFTRLTTKIALPTANEKRIISAPPEPPQP